MFTGLIEEIGTIKAIRTVGGGRRITVHAKKIMNDLKIDDSVALNGTCQTVVSLTPDSFDVEAVEETIRKTTLGRFATGMKINLERAAKLGDRMGGHLVQGHVDCTGYILSIIPEGAGKLVWISFPGEFRKYIVPIGSICIDGVSLTIAKAEATKFMVSVIPHTWQVTLFNELKSGTQVNLEFDIIGKYVENMMSPNINKDNGNKSDLEKFLSD
jgi:riboflavin synthase